MHDIREVNKKLDEIEEKLDETVSGIQTGPVKDAMRLVVPMMKDQVDAIRALVKVMQG